MAFTSGKGMKQISDIQKKLDEAAEAVNKAYGSHIVASKLVNGEFMTLVGESTIRKSKSYRDTIAYLEGLKRGVELMKGEM